MERTVVSSAVFTIPTGDSNYFQVCRTNLSLILNDTIPGMGS